MDLSIFDMFPYIVVFKTFVYFDAHVVPTLASGSLLTPASFGRDSSSLYGFFVLWCNKLFSAYAALDPESAISLRSSVSSLWKWYLETIVLVLEILIC